MHVYVCIKMSLIGNLNFQPLGTILFYVFLNKRIK